MRFGERVFALPNTKGKTIQDRHFRLFLPFRTLSFSAEDARFSRLECSSPDFRALVAGVIDGHGEHGAEVAERVKDVVIHALLASVNLADLFALAHHSLSDEIGFDSGCTLTIAIVTDKALLIMYAGDSQVAIISAMGDSHIVTPIRPISLHAEGAYVGRHGHRRLANRTKTRALSLGHTLGNYDIPGSVWCPAVVVMPSLEHVVAVAVASDGWWESVPLPYLGLAVCTGLESDYDRIFSMAQLRRLPRRDDVTLVIVYLDALDETEGLEASANAADAADAADAATDATTEELAHPEERFTMNPPFASEPVSEEACTWIDALHTPLHNAIQPFYVPLHPDVVPHLIGRRGKRIQKLQQLWNALLVVDDLHQCLHVTPRDVNAHHLPALIAHHLSILHETCAHRR